jgi:cephalosporin-C deacetylase
MRHNYPFDPTYGYSLDALLKVAAPAPPADYEAYWRRRYEQTFRLRPQAELSDTRRERLGWRIFELAFTSTNNVCIGGWFLTPASGSVRRGLIVGHGYGGRSGPDFDCLLEETALLFPCFRGLGRSVMAQVSSDPQWHVLQNIEDRDRYILGGCIEDLWTAVTVLLALRPEVEGRIGYVGSSFGGGIGALALAWDKRVRLAHLHIPTFGHQPLRLQLPTTGSAASLQQFARSRADVVQTLSYYDAAVAARFITIPVQCACARFDPAVAPPGQFAIYNSLAGPKDLVLLRAGHHAIPDQEQENGRLFREMTRFLNSL